MSAIELTARDIATMMTVADVLIAETPSMPSPSSVDGYEGLLRRAVKACGHDDDQIRQALTTVPSDFNWEAAKAFATTSPQSFHILSQLTAAAYYICPEILARLKYPVERRHPPAVDEFANEFESGILDPVMEMAPRFRETR